LLGFQRRYEQIAAPFDWRFTRSDLDRLLRRLEDHEELTKARMTPRMNFHTVVLTEFSELK
jgi:hypothetical protein